MHREKRSRWMFALVFATLATLLLWGGWKLADHQSRMRDRVLRNTLLSQAESLADNINPVRGLTLSFTPDDAPRPEFQRLQQQLIDYAYHVPHLKWAYLMAQVDGEIRFGPASLPESDPEYDPPGIVYTDAPPALAEVFTSRQSRLVGPYHDQWGTFVSAFAPIIDPQDGQVLMVLGLDIEATVWHRDLAQARRMPWLFTALSLTALAVLFGLGWPRRRQGLLSRHIPAWTILLVGLILSTGTGLLTQQAAESNRRQTLSALGQARAHSAFHALFTLRDRLEGLARLFDSSRFVSSREFQLFTRPFTRSGLATLWGWVPAVTAPDEPDRYPLTYLESPRDPPVVADYDLARLPEARAALEEAARNHLPTASAPFSLPAGAGVEPYLLVAQAVDLGKGGRPGFVIALVPLAISQQSALLQSFSHEIDVQVDLFQLKADQPPALLTATQPATARQHGLTPEFWGPDTPYYATVECVFTLGRTYAVLVHPSEIWLAEHPLWIGYLVGGGGLLLTVLVAAMVVFLTDRRARLETMVRTRTRELEASENKYRSLFEDNNAVMLIIEPETGDIVDANRAAAEFYGWTLDELRGLNINRINTLPDDEVKIEMNRARREDRRQFFFQHRRADGSVRDVEVYAGPIEVAGRSLLYSMVHDITARKEAELALRESEQRFRQVVENAPEGTLIETDGCFAYANPALLSILGLTTPEELLGRPLLEWIHPDDQVSFRERMRTVNEDRQPIAEIERVIRRRDGGEAILSVSAIPTIYRGRPGAVVFARDITVIRRHEQALRRVSRLNAALSHINRALATVQSREEFFAEICRIMTETVKLRLAWVGWVDEAQNVQVVTQSGDTTQYLADTRITTRDESRGQGPMGICIREGRIYVCDDFLADEHSAPWRAKAELAGLRGVAVLPIREGGVVRGALAIYADQTAFFGPEERSLLEETAVALSFALDHLANEARRRTAEVRSAKLLKAVEQSPATIVITDRDGCIEYVNPRFTEVSGYTAEEAIGQNPRVLKSGEQSTADYARMWQALVSGKQWRGEFHNRRKDGTLYWESASISPLTDEQGRITHFVAVKEDITTRKAMEQMLEQEIIQRRILIDQSSDGIVVLNDQGRIHESNRRFADMLGYTPEEMKDLAVWDWEADYPPEVLRDMIRTVSEKGQHFETRHRRKDGTLYDVEISTNGSICQGRKLIFCVCRDITQRKRIEAALRESERTYRLLAENTTDVIWVLDPATDRFTYASPSVVNLCGYTVAEMREMGLADVLTPEFIPQAWALARERQADFERGLAVPHVDELQLRCKDGSWIWIEVSSNFILNPENGRVEVLGVSRNITARKKAEEETRRLNQQLTQAQKMESIGRLAGGIAHDFNNLLQAISGFGEILQSTLPGGDQRRADLAEILKAAQRAAELTRQLLAFSRRQSLAPRVLDLNALVENTHRMLDRLVGEDVQIELHLDPTLLRVEADPGQIEQILLNLSVNARDAMPKGGRITVRTRNLTVGPDGVASFPNAEPGRYCCLELSDTGQGMDAETLAHIFEPFFTTKAQGKGTGLGLSVVYGIVQQHKGFITVQSEPGAGTRFQVHLPAFHAPTHTADRPADLDPLNLDVWRGQGERILLVEDEVGVSDFISRLLGSLNYDVQPAANLAEARALWATASAPFQLVLSDVVLPDGNGLDFALEIRSQYPELPIILASGYPGERSRDEEIRRLHICFLNKPFPTDVLLRNIHQNLHPRPESSA